MLYSLPASVRVARGAFSVAFIFSLCLGSRRSSLFTSIELRSLLLKYYAWSPIPYASNALMRTLALKELRNCGSLPIASCRCHKCLQRRAPGAGGRTAMLSNFDKHLLVPPSVHNSSHVERAVFAQAANPHQARLLRQIHDCPTLEPLRLPVRPQCICRPVRERLPY